MEVWRPRSTPNSRMRCLIVNEAEEEKEAAAVDEGAGDAGGGGGKERTGETDVRTCAGQRCRFWKVPRSKIMWYQGAA